MTSMTTQQGNYAAVNGINLYYEEHGTGAPLVLLHGGGGSIGMFGELLPTLAAERRVIAVDLQAHGRTADIDRPLRIEHMADDIAALLAHLGIASADIMGYSLGGAVSIQTAIRHPEIISRLVVVSTPHRRTGWYPSALAGMDQMNGSAAEFLKQTPMYAAYAAIAPRVEDWPILWEKMGDLLRQDYDWSAGVARLTMPTMLLFGDADGVSPAVAAEFFGLLGGGQEDGSWDRSGVTPHRLAILPNTTHYDIFASPALVPAILPFLDAPLPSGK